MASAHGAGPTGARSLARTSVSGSASGGPPCRRGLEDWADCRREGVQPRQGEAGEGERLSKVFSRICCFAFSVMASGLDDLQCQLFNLCKVIRLVARAVLLPAQVFLNAVSKS